MLPKTKHHNKESIYLQYSLGRLITYSCSLKSTIKQGTKLDGVDLLQDSPILNIAQHHTRDFNAVMNSSHQTKQDSF